MDLKQYLKNEILREQQAITESFSFHAVEDYATYKERVGEIRGLQRVIRMIEDLPDE